MAALRAILTITLILLGASIYQAALFAREMGVSLASLRWLLIFSGLGAALLLMIGLLVMSWSRHASAVQNWIDKTGRALSRHTWFHLPLAALLATLQPFIVLYLDAGLAEEIVLSTSWRATLFWLVSLAGGLLFKLHWPDRSIGLALSSAILVYAAAYRIGVFTVDLSTYPFSLTWSEASRYFYASLFFGERVYGTGVNPTVLHPSRYALQSLPFLFEGSPLWLHRLWQVLLWLSTNALAAWLLVRRLGRLGSEQAQANIQPLLMTLWAFLFIFQGPVWYHLVVMVILVFWGVRTDRPGQTWIVVLLASVWAGVSRINWIPLPALLAITLYVLEQPLRGRSFIHYWQYWRAPVLWTLTGALAGLAAQAGYAVWSGNDLGQFSSSFSADLLWYRLLPSATYPLGVLPGILLASLPVVWIVWVALRGRWRDFHWLRHLAIALILGVFFGGGLVVSAKIGGGSNLHNMDAYLVILMAVGAYVFAGFYSPEPGQPAQSAQSAQTKPTAWMLAAAIVIPAAFTVFSGEPESIPTQADVERELASLQESVAAAADRDVLFIAERHLLAFDYVGKLSLVEPYEKVFLMEMAMSSNVAYLDQFKQDLADHRFSLIITSPQRPVYQDQEDDFGEENNAWVEHVSLPVLCYYEEQALLEDVRVQLLQPKILEPVCSGDQCFDPTGAEPIFGRQGCIFTPDLRHFSQIDSQDAAERTRQELQDLVWTGGLPDRLPEAHEPLETRQYSQAASAEVLTISTDAGLVSHPVFFEPVSPTNRLMIYHHGHDGGINSSRVLINKFLTAGYHVLAFDMPLLGANPTTQAFQVHDDLRTLDNPLQVFLDPVAVGLNFALAELGPVEVYMTGLEGGAWTTLLYTAIDVRIQGSYLINPPLPYYIRNQIGRFLGDFEERDPALLGTAGYLDLYLMAAAGRRQVHIFPLGDPCCLSGEYAGSYEGFVSRTLTGLGGSFDVWIEPGVSVDQLVNQAAADILADIEVKLRVE